MIRMSFTLSEVIALRTSHVCDCQAWFEQASDDEILALDGDGWCCSYLSDEVADFVCGLDVKNADQAIVASLWMAASGLDCGTSTYIEIADADRWLRETGRTELRNKLLANEGYFALEVPQ